ncbi:MAG: helix-turn-helix transcriptional regulator [Clostridiales bacterium]|nr:helix-turn-helix transcriptional regulator [Clostridiales bacterium]
MRKNYSSRQKTEAMAVLFEPVRFEIVSRIASLGTARQVDVQDSFDITQPTMSHHLNLLVENKILNAVREGRCVYYSVNPVMMEEASEILLSLASGEVKVRKASKEAPKKASKPQAVKEEKAPPKKEGKNRSKSKGKDKDKVKAKDKKDKSKKKKKK